MSGLGAALSAAEQAQRAAALRYLLANPLVSREREPDIFATVVRNRELLAQWFFEHPGWRLVVQPAAGFARLYKIPSRPDQTRPAKLRDKPPFDRRRYVLLCLMLAALDESPVQTTLLRLAGLLEDLTKGEPGIQPFDQNLLSERRAFIDVLLWLDDAGVLRLRDGDSERYVHDRSRDALYRVDDALLGQMIAAPVPPTLAGTPDRMSIEPYSESDEGDRLRARHRVMRALLDEAVVYYEDLSQAEREWLNQARGFVYRRLQEDAGFQVERRREGLAAVDLEGKTTDTLFPDGGSTVKHAALLIAEQLLSRTRREGRQIYSDDEVVELAHDLMEDYGTICSWSRKYMEGRDARGLALDAMELLEQFNLVRRGAGGWRIRPAIARFAPAAPGGKAEERR